MSNIKQLKKLSREELIEILLRQTEQSETLASENTDLKESLAESKQLIEKLSSELEHYKSAFAQYGKTIASNPLSEEQTIFLADRIAFLLLEELKTNSEIPDDKIADKNLQTISNRKKRSDSKSSSVKKKRHK